MFFSQRLIDTAKLSIHEPFANKNKHRPLFAPNFSFFTINPQIGISDRNCGKLSVSSLDKFWVMIGRKRTEIMQLKSLNLPQVIFRVTSPIKNNGMLTDIDIQFNHPFLDRADDLSKYFAIADVSFIRSMNQRNVVLLSYSQSKAYLSYIIAFLFVLCPLGNFTTYVCRINECVKVSSIV